MDVIPVIAIYGAILSSLNAFWEFCRFRKDRAVIKIMVKTEQMSSVPLAMYDNSYIRERDENFIEITVSNAGFRPVTIKSCEYRRPSYYAKKWLPISYYEDSIYRLNEGESHLYKVGERQVKEWGISDKDLIIRITDATGRLYWSDGIFKRYIRLWRCDKKNKVERKKKKLM